MVSIGKGLAFAALVMAGTVLELAGKEDGAFLLIVAVFWIIWGDCKTGESCHCNKSEHKRNEQKHG